MDAVVVNSLEELKKLVSSFDMDVEGNRLLVEVGGSPTEVKPWLVDLSREISDRHPNVEMVGVFRHLHQNQWTGEKRIFAKEFTRPVDYSRNGVPMTAREISEVVPGRMEYILRNWNVVSTVLDFRVHGTEGPWL